MNGKSEQEKTLESIYCDSEQVMTLLKLKDHAPSIKRLAWNLQTLIGKLGDPHLPDVLKREIVLKIRPYVNYFTQRQSTIKDILDDECIKHLQNATVKLQQIKNNSDLELPQDFTFNEFIASFSTQSIPAVTQSNKPTQTTTQGNYYPGPISVLIKQLCQPEGSFVDALFGSGDKKYLLRERNGYPTTGFLNNVAVLNFVQTYLTGPFDENVLNELLDAKYGYRMYKQREVMSNHFPTLYPYLRFALIGRADHKSNAILDWHSEGAPVHHVDENRDIQASPNLLLAVLRHKVKSEVLVDALIGGMARDVEYSGSTRYESYNRLPPLIFDFAASEIHIRIILKNILYTTSEPITWRLVETKKYQANNASELLRLIHYMWKNAVTSEQRSATAYFTQAAIAEVMKGEDALTLKEIYKIQGNPDFIMPGETRKATMASTKVSKQQHKALIQRIDNHLQTLGKSLANASNVKKVHQYQQKINVLEAAKKLLNGEQLNFSKIKLENPEYLKGLFHHKTKDLVLEVENVLKARSKTPSTISNSVSANSKKLIYILNTLIKNIEEKANKRLTSGKKSKKVKQLRLLRDEIEGDPSLSEDKIYDYVDSIKKLCAIKRNKLHFWHQPESVAELETLIQQSRLKQSKAKP